jgi:hypothetical protein
MSASAGAKKPGETRRPVRETNAVALRRAMLRRLPRRLSAAGRIRLPAVPSLIEVYLERLQAIFAALGRTFSAAETATLQALLEPQLAAGFAASPFCHVVVSYETDDPPAETLSYRITLENQPGYLHSRVEGENTAENIARYFRETYQACVARGLRSTNPPVFGSLKKIGTASWSMRMPSASRTSAEPLRDVIARLPCMRISRAGPNGFKSTV